jgi:small ubiquitin-related modifier
MAMREQILRGVEQENDEVQNERVSDLINLHFKDQQGYENNFKVIKTIKMENMFNEFAEKKGINVAAIQFMLDGKRINKFDTPQMLELQQDDMVDVFLNVTGGGVEEESEEQEKKTPAATDGDADNAAITLKVVDSSGEEMFFKVKKTTKMKKIMDAYAEKKGVNLKAIRFTHDGERIKEDDTPKMLELEDDDQIDVRLETVGGGVEEEEDEQKPNIAEKEDKATADNILTLQLKDQAGDVLSFKVKDSSQMRKIFAAYASRKGVPVDTFRFLLDGNRVNPNETPSSLSLEDNDQIDVMLEYAGGV